MSKIIKKFAKNDYYYNPQEKKKSSLLWLFLFLIFMGIGLALSILSREVPEFAPFYSTKIYPLWQGTLGRFSGLFPFSLSEAILYSLPVILILDIIFIIVRKRRRFSGVIKRILVFLSLLFCIYTANCGVNYFNKPFLISERVPIVEPNLPRIVQFCQYLVDELNHSSEENMKGTSPQDYYPQGRELAEEAVVAMNRLGGIYPSLSGYYSKPKAITNSRPFSNMGVTGIYSPFTIEANYNREMTPYNLPFTACHELSHLKGYMDEGEANFIGFLACINSDNKAFNRSGLMMAWVYAGNELYRLDRDTFSKLRKSLPEDVIQELDDNNEFWDTYETKASEIQDQINDAYLQYNGLEEGIVSYDTVTVMMVSWFFTSAEASI